MFTNRRRFAKGKNEWEGLKKHDTIFLLTIRPRLSYGTPFDAKVNFLHQYGVEYVRGVEVEGFLDNEGRVIEDWIEKPHFTGNQRTLRVWLDTNQYHMTKTLQMVEKAPTRRLTSSCAAR